MAKWRVVVKDPAVEHARSRGRGFTHERRPQGFVHAADLDDACPMGRPNCRNCGDPKHAEACRLAGHCPDCGTRHGIAPDATLEANGYGLERD